MTRARPRGPRRARAIAAGALPLAVAAGAAIACGDDTYIFEARRFVPARACLGTPSGLDVIAGRDPGACAPTCLVQRIEDGGTDFYATAKCAPYPFGFATGQEPTCAAALAAFARDDTCLADGSTHPAPEAGP